MFLAQVLFRDPALGAEQGSVERSSSNPHLHPTHYHYGTSRAYLYGSCNPTFALTLTSKRLSSVQGLTVSSWVLGCLFEEHIQELKGSLIIISNNYLRASLLTKKVSKKENPTERFYG